MNGQEFRSALKQGHRVYGTLIVSPAPEWPNAVKNIGLDFVFIHIILLWLRGDYVVFLRFV